MINLLFMLFWFFVVTATGVAYMMTILYLLRKKVIGDVGAKVMYFGTFVALICLVNKLI